jgi:hypothetical protein
MICTRIRITLRSKPLPLLGCSHQRSPPRRAARSRVFPRVACLRKEAMLSPIQATPSRHKTLEPSIRERKIRAGMRRNHPRKRTRTSHTRATLIQLSTLSPRRNRTMLSHLRPIPRSRLRRPAMRLSRARRLPPVHRLHRPPIHGTARIRPMTLSPRSNNPFAPPRRVATLPRHQLQPLRRTSLKQRDVQRSLPKGRSRSRGRRRATSRGLPL